MALIHGRKQSVLIELSLEPWLLEPVTAVDIPTQYERMGPAVFREIIAYAQETRYDTQYLWGGEWWYWLKGHGKPALWEQAKELFN